MDTLHNFADVVIASEVPIPWHLQVRLCLAHATTNCIHIS